MRRRSTRPALVSTAFTTWAAESGHVREVINVTEQVTGRPVAVSWGPAAREPRELRADSSRIQNDLGWRPTRSGLETIIGDAWQALSSSPAY